MKIQIRDYLRVNELIRGHSTTTALMKVTHDIKTAMDKKLTTVLLLLLDF